MHVIAGKTIQEALANAFEIFADKVAVRYGEKEVRYAELDRMSEYIAKELIRAGYGKGHKAGIFTNDIFELLCCILGVLKAGAIFVPLDTALPPLYVKNLAGTIALDCLIITGRTAQDLPGAVPIVIDLSSGNWECVTGGTMDGQDLALIYEADDPIYIYFTSGSTGTPNAVLGKNSSLLQFVQWETATFNTNGLNVSQLSAPGFDTFLRDTFVPLCSGGTICLLPDRTILKDPFALRKWINTQEIQLIHCVPSILMMLLESGLDIHDFEHLEYILLAGERLVPSKLGQWFNLFGERIQLINLYGATETTMIKTYYCIRAEDAMLERIPIGKPIDGARALILDEDMNICDEETVGELYIRTPYSSLGYYNNPGLTRKKFIPNPFTGNENDLIYKTGDLCKIRSDGNIDFIGRADRQVKIRGIRVELEDIENRICRIPFVKEAAVRQFKNIDNTLVAFIVSNETNAGVTVDKYLHETMPEYMIPGRVLIVNELPRKMNGKIAFDKLELLLNEDSLHLPENAEEEKLFTCWKEILGHRNFGTTTSFFGAGGHSLNMLLLINRMKKVFSMPMSIEKFFELDTIEKQALYFREDIKKVPVKAIRKAEKREYYPVSSTQKRLYFLYELSPANTAYNLWTVFDIAGELDLERLEKAFGDLIGRHEILRTSFMMMDGTVVQRVHEKGQFKLAVAEWGKEELTADSLKEYIKPLDLHGPDLCQVILLVREKKRFLLLINSHHIVSDGFSQVQMFRELTKLYEGVPLPAVQLSYKDYCIWQSRMSYDVKISQQEMFWKGVLSDFIELLRLPCDYERKPDFEGEGKTIWFELEEQLDKGIIEFADSHNTTPNVVIHSLYNVLLSIVCNQTNIVTGIPVLGRSHSDLENVMGVFINMIVINAEIDSAASFADIVQGNTKQLMLALDNQDYPFEELVKWAKFEREEGRNPLIDASYAYRDFHFEDISVAGLTIKPYMLEKPGAKYDLSLAVDKNGSRFLFSFVYARHLFKEETMEMFIKYFKKIAIELIGDPRIPVKEVLRKQYFPVTATCYEDLEKE